MPIGKNTCCSKTGDSVIKKELLKLQHNIMLDAIIVLKSQISERRCPWCTLFDSMIVLLWHVPCNLGVINFAARSFDPFGVTSRCSPITSNNMLMYAVYTSGDCPVSHAFKLEDLLLLFFFTLITIYVGLTKLLQHTPQPFIQFDTIDCIWIVKAL